MLENLNSQRKTKSFKNMSSLGTNQAKPNPREGKEDLDRIIRWERAQVTVAVGGGEEGEAAGVVGEGEEVTLVTRPIRARTKLQGVITTGNEATTKRWRGRGLHLDNRIVHRCVMELLRQLRNGDSEVQ